jgi:hypothetical protein
VLFLGRCLAGAARERGGAWLDAPAGHLRANGTGLALLESPERCPLTAEGDRA